ncbi:hypothetical protein CCH79_00020983, partial [Gambusia affinis]
IVRVLRLQQSHLASAAAAVLGKEQRNRPGQRRQESSWPPTEPGRHGGDKAEDLSEGHKVPVRRSGRV